MAGNFFLVGILFAAVENDFILRPENIGLVFREKVIIGFAEQVFKAMADQFAKRLIQQYPAVLPVLDEYRIGNGIDDPFQEMPRLCQHPFRLQEFQFC